GEGRERNSEMVSRSLPTSGVLQRRGDERVLKDIQSFVEVGAGVFRGDAGAEANSIVRDSRIIDRCNPKSTPTQFVTEPIHAFPITNDDWHHVGCRCSGVDAELAQFFVKVIGVLPNDFSPCGSIAYGNR